MDAKLLKKSIFILMLALWVAAFGTPAFARPARRVALNQNLGLQIVQNHSVQMLRLSQRSSCPRIEVQNKSDWDWNHFDQTQLVRAIKRCGQKYQQSPCLKVFRKRGERDYSAICGSLDIYEASNRR